MKDITIVNTHGKVLQQGTQGVRIVSEDGTQVMDFSESSDDTCTNVFVRFGEGLNFLPEEDLVQFSWDMEILMSKTS